MTRFKNYFFTGITLIQKVKNWPAYVLDRFGFLHGKSLVYSFWNGAKIKIRPASSDWFIVNEVLVCNSYDSSDVAVAKGDVVVDVGAHLGAFSVFAGRRGARVFAFEPAPENFVLLNENIALNGLLNVATFNAAIANASGRAKFYMGLDACAYSLYAAADKTKAVDVPTISLQNVMDQNRIVQIDFLKMDCEGAEYDIVLNCPSAVLGKIKKIALECHDMGIGKNEAAMREFLEKSGFSVMVEYNHRSHGQYLFAKNNNR